MRSCPRGGDPPYPPVPPPRPSFGSSLELPRLQGGVFLLGYDYDYDYDYDYEYDYDYDYDEWRSDESIGRIDIDFLR